MSPKQNGDANDPLHQPSDVDEETIPSWQSKTGAILAEAAGERDAEADGDGEVDGRSDGEALSPEGHGSHWTPSHNATLFECRNNIANPTNSKKKLH